MQRLIPAACEALGPELDCVSAAQLIQCTNNIRLAPSLFQSDISAVCNFDDVQGAAMGLNALRSSPALSSVAQAHSDDEAAQNYFSHFSSNGSSPYDRVHSMVSNADFVSELTAAGWPSVRSVLVQLVWWAPASILLCRSLCQKPFLGCGLTPWRCAVPPSTGASL